MSTPQQIIERLREIFVKDFFKHAIDDPTRVLVTVSFPKCEAREILALLTEEKKT